MSTVAAQSRRNGVAGWPVADLVVRNARVYRLDWAVPWAGAVAVSDSHNHVRLGSDADCVQLAGAGSLAEVRARIAAWLADYPAAEWVEGEGWTTPRCGRTRRIWRG